jgi:hypothetical protein
MNPPEHSAAFGAPGIEPRWMSSAKEGLGSAYHRSCRLWFTPSHGIVNEIASSQATIVALAQLRAVLVLGRSKG